LKRYSASLRYLTLQDGFDNTWKNRSNNFNCRFSVFSVNSVQCGKVIEFGKSASGVRTINYQRQDDGRYIAIDMWPKEAKVAERFQKICAANHPIGVQHPILTLYIYNILPKQ
jgi:hypothetical protein